MKLSKSREKYLLEKYFQTKNTKNIPIYLSQFGCRDGDTSDEDLYFITQYVTEIDNLVLRNSFVTEYGLEFLKKLKSVKYLDVRGRNLNDDNLDCILHFANLEDLDIKSCNVSSNGIQQILESFPKLNTIRVDIPIADERFLNSWKEKYKNCDLIINLK